jgi:eukaryotic-like serine/threonine-protein kinase
MTPAQPSIDGSELAPALGASGAEFIGMGTYGETWRVDDIDGVPGRWAVKVLKPELFNPRTATREIEGLLRFDSPGIVKLFGVRQADLDGRPHVALICEYIEGGDVLARLRADGSPSSNAARKFAHRLLSAVAELHSAETVHRDIKPQNILLRDGRWSHPVLIDFGLARTLTEQTMTIYPKAVGSYLYMSPEQLRGEKARKAADLWACGVVLYVILTGTHPYGLGARQLSEEELIATVVGAPRPLPADIPSDLADVTLRLLSETPYRRGTAIRAAADLGGAR